MRCKARDYNKHDEKLSLEAFLEKNIVPEIAEISKLLSPENNTN